ncbi:hypothetical protein [Pseudonocardia sp. NPDC049635]|uniref:hypothetical protein n=1 Tax=Pseudonocardia sp. NPDC049635 TaxID=3155506 RepID=UPI0033E59BD5
MKPSTGRVVHYVSRGSADGRFPPACRAATVTEVARDHEHVGLAVLNPTGMFFHSLADGGVEFDPGTDRVTDQHALCDGRHHDGGTWHWPGRVEEDA